MKKNFDGIAQLDIERLKGCLHAVTETFDDGDTIIAPSDSGRRAGVILKGTAEALRYDSDGSLTILQRLTEGMLCGRRFFGIGDGSVRLVCKKSCEVMFFDYDKAIHRCENACPCHDRLIENLLEALADKIADQELRIDILSRRTLRKKLAAFFISEAIRQGRRSFTMPFTLATLADIICVDRSAMQREIRKMNDDGLIRSHAKRITLLEIEQAL